MTWEGVAAAAAGGFVGGFVAGAMAGTALTGDPSGVIAAAGIGFLSGAAGGAVESAVYQYLVNGTIDVTRLLMDMYRSAMFGAVTGGAATYLKGATPGLRDAVDDVLRPGGGLAVALPGGGVAVILAPAAAGAAMPGAISSAELAGTVVFSTGLGGALGPEDTPLPDEPTGPAPQDGAAEPNRGLMWVTERTGSSSAAKAWEDRVPGATYDVATRRRIVPALGYDNPTPRGKPFVRFDGVDPNNPKVLIGRKWGVTTKQDQVRKFKSGPLRALEQNPEYRLRIEVPNSKAAADARRLLREATGSSEHPQIEIVIVES